MSNANLIGLAACLAVTGSARGRGPCGRSAPRPPAGPRPGPLERLIEITRSNDLLMVQLAEARRRVGQAERYAADPGSRGALAGALVANARRRRGEILDRLAANRAEALALLAGRPAAL